MKPIAFTLILILCFSCSNDPESFIEHINGYWEIEQVTLSTGEKHHYTYNEVIDYFTVTDSLTGFRKKLKPLLNGAYEASKDAEQFILRIENDNLNIYYKTSFSSWKETILLATKNKLKIINENKDVFLYKSFTPLKFK